MIFIELFTLFNSEPFHSNFKLCIIRAYSYKKNSSDSEYENHKKVCLLSSIYDETVQIIIDKFKFKMVLQI